MGGLLTAPLYSSHLLRRAHRSGVCADTPGSGHERARERRSQRQWVLPFNKELVPKQIMSLRTLLKASYFTQDKSLSSHNGSKACRIGGWGLLDPLDITWHLPNSSHTSLHAVLQQARGAPASGSSHLLFPNRNALLPDIN